jgi:hypothetical protein
MLAAISALVICLLPSGSSSDLEPRRGGLEVLIKRQVALRRERERKLICRNANEQKQKQESVKHQTATKVHFYIFV